MPRLVALVLLVPMLAAPAAQERPLPDYQSFAAEVKKHLATDEERQSGYMFIERRTDQRLDGNGRVKSAEVKVFEVYPGLPGEERYQRLIEEDGKPVPPSKLAERDLQRRKQVEDYARKMANAGDRRKQEQQVEKERSHYRRSVPHLRHPDDPTRGD
jgi:hypothetical protein